MCDVDEVCKILNDLCFLVLQPVEDFSTFFSAVIDDKVQLSAAVTDSDDTDVSCLLSAVFPPLFPSLVICSDKEVARPRQVLL